MSKSLIERTGYVNEAYDDSGGGLVVDETKFHTIELNKIRRDVEDMEEDAHYASALKNSLDDSIDGYFQTGAGEVSDGEGELRWGWGPLRPKCLQRFRTAKWALFWLCCAGAIQGMVVNGFINVVITTIERRFGLRSSQSGLIAGGYDVASFVCLAPVTYLGGRARASKPRWLGWGSLLMGAGSLLFALPHFVAPPYRAIEDALVRDTCDNITINIPDSCNSGAPESGAFGGGALWVFLVAQLLHGAGAAPLFTLGVTYIDENVSKKMSSVYLGIYYTMAVVGPAVGFVLGGQLLTVYTDFLSVYPSDVGLSASSSAWVGAWWVGFVLAALLCVVVAVPLLAFPYELPGAAELAAERVSEAHGAISAGGANGDARGGAGAGPGVGSVDAKGSGSDSLRGLPHACRELLRNPAFMYLNLAGASEGMFISGFAAFLPKLIENQFSVNASFAALLLGVITVPAGGGGTFLGGWLVKHWRLSCAGILRLCAVATLCAAAFTFCFVLSCPNLPFAGVTAPYAGQPDILPHTRSTWSRLESSCNADCGCARAAWSPVCGADGNAYYSPCHAGCRTRRAAAAFAADTGALLYDDCDCIVTSISTMHRDAMKNERENMSIQKSASASAPPGILPVPVPVPMPQSRPYSAINRPCASSCQYLWLFVLLAFGIMFFTFLATMPALSATLRCVRDSQRSFALGVQWILVRLLGTIPAPVIFGALIDRTCLLWQHECGGRGACLLYDNLYMSRYMLALAFITKGCSLLFFFLAWWYYVPPQPTKSSKLPLAPPLDDLSTSVAVARAVAVAVDSNHSATGAGASNGHCNNVVEHERF